MAKFFSVRKPRLRISKKGKISLSGGSTRIGGRNAGLNFSKKGVSFSSRGKFASYNSRTGTSFRCLPMLILLSSFGIATLIIGVRYLFA